MNVPAATSRDEESAVFGMVRDEVVALGSVLLYRQSSYSSQSRTGENLTMYQQILV